MCSQLKVNTVFMATEIRISVFSRLADAGRSPFLSWLRRQLRQSGVGRGRGGTSGGVPVVPVPAK